MRGIASAVKFSPHAIERAHQRGVSESLLKETLQKPARVQLLRPRVYRYVVPGCCVIGEVDPSDGKITILTCFKIRRGRYM